MMLHARRESTNARSKEASPQTIRHSIIRFVWAVSSVQTTQTAANAARNITTPQARSNRLPARAVIWRLYPVLNKKGIRNKHSTMTSILFTASAGLRKNSRSWAA